MTAEERWRLIRAAAITVLAVAVFAVFWWAGDYSALID
jgi:hypothetical protein